MEQPATLGGGGISATVADSATAKTEPQSKHAPDAALHTASPFAVPPAEVCCIMHSDANKSCDRRQE